MAKIHVLKTWPEHWQEIEAERKSFEVRKDDRGFSVGDCLVLRKFCPDAGCVKDRSGAPQDITKWIGHLLQGGQFGIEEGFVVMSLNNTPPTGANEGET